MAKDKKSFLLYADLIHMVRKMNPTDAGELFLIILEYVNDNDPSTDNTIVDLTFEPIKQQLKRDLIKYEDKRKQWSEAGKASAKAKKDKKLTNQQTLTDVKDRSTESTVSVNDSVNVIQKKKIKRKNLKERTQLFKEELSEFKEKYHRDLLNEFYLYWTEPNALKTKLKFEMEKTWDISRRLTTWQKRDKQYKPEQPKTVIPTSSTFTPDK